MEKITELEDFQNFLDDIPIRNKSILDQMMKLQDASAKLNRSISKSSTTCGCTSMSITKQHYSLMETLSHDELKTLLSSHIEGHLCPNCEEAIEKEMGRLLFYLSALANTLGISLSSVLENEKARTALLSNYCLK